MRRFAITTIALLGLAAPGAALAQGAAQASPAQKPAQPAAAPAATDDTSRSLFALTDRELFVGGRATSIDGDPARFQRYQDVRDGLLFSGFRYAFAQPGGAHTFNARANNVGWRDQEYFANYDRVGKLSVTGSYQGIPQFYSVDIAPCNPHGRTKIGPGQPDRRRLAMGYNVLKLPKNQACVKEKARAAAPYAPASPGRIMNHIFV